MHQDLIVRSVERVFELTPTNEVQALNSERADAIRKKASQETQRAWKADWKVWLAFCNSGCLEYENYKNLDTQDSRRSPLPAAGRPASNQGFHRLFQSSNPE